MPALRKLEQESIDLRLCFGPQPGNQTPRPRARYPHTARKQHDQDAADGHAVAEQHAPGSPVRHEFLEQPAEMHRRAGPERKADDHAGAVIEAFIDQDPEAGDEQHGQQHDQVRSDHWAGDGQHRSHYLGQQRKKEKKARDGDPHVTGRYTRDLRDRTAEGIG